jgi:hypothetical protein
MLQGTPSKEQYLKANKWFKDQARRQYIREISKAKDPKQYDRDIAES